MRCKKDVKELIWETMSSNMMGSNPGIFSSSKPFFGLDTFYWKYKDAIVIDDNFE